MRVTGGELRGRRLHVPPESVRPTSDRVRESLFSILGDLSDANVLDLYAGTGSLGIESLSRGARSAVFVDRATGSLQVLRRNLADLGLDARTRVVRGEVVRRLRAWSEESAQRRFDLVFLDPPYDADEIPGALEALRAAGVLDPRATVVVESATRHSWAPAAEWILEDRRSYGDTEVSILSLDPGPTGSSHGG